MVTTIALIGFCHPVTISSFSHSHTLKLPLFLSLSTLSLSFCSFPLPLPPPSPMCSNKCSTLKRSDQSPFLSFFFFSFFLLFSSPSLSQFHHLKSIILIIFYCLPNQAYLSNFYCLPYQIISHNFASSACLALHLIPPSSFALCWFILHLTQSGNQMSSLHDRSTEERKIHHHRRA